MINVLRAALPGYNALTEENIYNYSLYTDSDNVLIKELARGSGSLASGETVTIAHNLGYVPHVKVFGRQTSGTTTDWTLLLAGGSEAGLLYVEADTTNIYITKINNGATGAYQYYIFYDQQV